MEEQRYCSYCGHKLEPEARFCSNCGRPVHRAANEPSGQQQDHEELPTSEVPTTSQLPTSSPPSSQQHQLFPDVGAQQQRRGSTWWLAMVGLVGILVIVVVVEGVGGMLWEAIPVLGVVGAVVLIGAGISYLSLRSQDRGVSVAEAVFNWSVVVLAGFTAFLFLIS